MTAVEEYLTKWRGGETAVPSSPRKRTGAFASSGGVSATDWTWAVSTIAATVASRSAVVTKRKSMVCFEASAMRFQWFQTDRFTLTAATTLAAIASMAGRGTASADMGIAVAPI